MKRKNVRKGVFNFDVRSKLVEIEKPFKAQEPVNNKQMPTSKVQEEVPNPVKTKAEPNVFQNLQQRIKMDFNLKLFPSHSDIFSFDEGECNSATFKSSIFKPKKESRQLATTVSATSDWSKGVLINRYFNSND